MDTYANGLRHHPGRCHSGRSDSGRNRPGRSPLALITLALIAVVVLSCASNRVFVNLDMLSFMSAEERSFLYLLPGVTPGEVYADTTAVSDITLAEGLDDIVHMEELSLDLALSLDNTEVIGQIGMTYRIEIYLAASPEPAELWREENRLLELSGPLESGTVTTVSEERIDINRFLPLLEENERLYTVALLEIRHDSGVGLIDGVGEITQLMLHITSRADLF